MKINCNNCLSRCRRDVFLPVFLFVVVSLFGVSVQAQKDLLKGSEASPSPSPASSISPSPTTTPIPLVSVVTQSDSAMSVVRKADTFISQQEVDGAIVLGLPAAARDIEKLDVETRRMLQSHVSLDELTTVENDWVNVSSQLSGWKKSIQSKVTAVEEKIAELRVLLDLWQRTVDSLNNRVKPDQPEQQDQDGAAQTVEIVPEELLSRANSVLSSITEAKNQADEKRSELLKVESRIAELQSSVNNAVQDIKNRREGSLSQLFVRDAPPFWSADWASIHLGTLASDAGKSISLQWDDLFEYAQAYSGRFAMHALVVCLFTLGLYWGRGRIIPMVENEPRLHRAAVLFQNPLASALILSLLFLFVFYSRPPRVLQAFLGIIGIVPGVLILRRFVKQPVKGLLYFVLGLFLYDRVRDIFQTLPLTTRLLFSIETLAAITFLIWFFKSDSVSKSVEAGSVRIFKLIHELVPFAIAIFAVSFVANALGFVALSTLIGNSLLRSVYVGIFLYTAVQIILSIATFLVRVYPFTELRFILNNPDLVISKARQAINWLAWIVWFFSVLSVLSLRDAFLATATSFAEFGVKWGKINISISDIVLLAVAVWLTFLTSRFIRFVLEEDVYPRMDLGGGVSYAVSTVVHYLFLTIGFLLAFVALGVRLSEFAVLAGAVGIGLGFGLQNIINNFVSGLILLFERPVKVGDLVQVGHHQGTLNSIGLRASVVRKVDGSDVILPNSKLISDEVVNWTLSDELRRLEIPFGVAYGTDPKKVIEIITAVAVSNPEVTADPAPNTLFQSFGDSALNFELRAWTANGEGWIPLRSRIVTEIYAALTKEGVEIPFPQRDLNIKNFPPTADPPLKKPSKGNG